MNKQCHMRKLANFSGMSILPNIRVCTRNNMKPQTTLVFFFFCGD